MISKQITLKIHCSNCLEIVSKKVALITVPSISILEKLNTAILRLFPKTETCHYCGSTNLERCYSFMHEHKYEKLPQETIETEIERCKEQIAATFDDNSDIPKAERLIIREAFQGHLHKLLTQQQVNH